MQQRAGEDHVTASRRLVEAPVRRAAGRVVPVGPEVSLVRAVIAGHHVAFHPVGVEDVRPRDGGRDHGTDAGVDAGLDRDILDRLVAPHRDAAAHPGARRARLDNAQIGPPRVPRAPTSVFWTTTRRSRRSRRASRSERARSAAASGGLDAVLVSSHRSPCWRGETRGEPSGGCGDRGHVSRDERRAAACSPPAPGRQAPAGAGAALTEPWNP